MKRNMCAVYMDEEMYDVFRVYAVKKAPRKAYEVWGKALATYMRDNPIECMVVQVQQDLSDRVDNGIQRELEEKVLCRRIDDCLGTLELIGSTGVGNDAAVLSDLIKAVSEAVKIHSAGDRLLSLLHKVKESGYLD